MRGLSAGGEQPESRSHRPTDPELLHVTARQLECLLAGGRGGDARARPGGDQALSRQLANHLGGAKAGVGLSTAAGLADTHLGQAHARAGHLRRILPRRVSETMGGEGTATGRVDPTPADLRDTDDGIEGGTNVGRQNYVHWAKERDATILRLGGIPLSIVQESIRLLS